MYYVYIHTVPNGKIYVGETKDIERRWVNGEGYSDNRPFYKDITIYGWNNIKHEIIATFTNKEPALRLESVLIAVLNAEDENYGYNQTTIYDDAMKRYASRVAVDGIDLEKPLPEEHFFEASNLPVSACTELIDQWIFNKEYRDIAKRRLIDGVTYPKLSEQYGKSVRQLKNIVYSCCDKLEKHL